MAFLYHGKRWIRITGVLSSNPNPFIMSDYEIESDEDGRTLPGVYP